MEIRLENLTKVYKGTKADPNGCVAVNNLDILIPDGKLVGLLGPSGCGKSTTLYMISGLLEPTSGRIWFGDEDVTDLTPEKRGIGLVFQNYALYPHMTIRRNISFPLENLRVEEEVVDDEGNTVMKKRKLTADEINILVTDAARLVQIDNLLDRKPSQLSGGQQQRVAIARALVKKPRVLLLDEPLSNLDARLRLQTREEIRRLQRTTGVTTVFVTHDQEEAMSICDEIVVMKNGLEQQKDAPQEVYNNPVNLFVAQFLGNPPINVFDGQIRDNALFIGKDKLWDITEEMARSASRIKQVVPVLNVTAQFADGQEKTLDVIGKDVICKVEPGHGYTEVETNPFHPIRGHEAEYISKELNVFVPANVMEELIKDVDLEKAGQCKLKLELGKAKKVSNSVILDQDVYVAVRPEGFSVGRDGCLSVFVEQIETLGRDISIVGTHPNCVKPTFKAIVDADTPVTPGQMKLGIKKNKCFVFTKDTEERIL